MNRREEWLEQKTVRASRRYLRSITRGQTSTRRDQAIAAQVAKFAAATRAALELGEKVKEVISRHETPVTHLALYRTFALHLGRLRPRYTDDDFALLCIAAINRWTSYGLSPAALRHLCREVFEVRV